MKRTPCGWTINAEARCGFPVSGNLMTPILSSSMNAMCLWPSSASVDGSISILKWRHMYSDSQGVYTKRGITLYLKVVVLREGLGAEASSGVRGGAREAERLYLNIGINFGLDLMQWQLFCNSTILYYKHSYSATGTQLQTPTISYFLTKNATTAYKSRRVSQWNRCSSVKKCYKTNFWSGLPNVGLSKVWRHIFVVELYSLNLY